MGITRKTKTVKAVLSEFETSSNARSVVELVDCLSSTMNRTTVYRILDRLEDEGTLHSFVGESGLKWYAKHDGQAKDSMRMVHPHFQCRQCGTSKCVQAEVQLPNLNQYTIETASLLLTGVCDQCS